MIASDLLRKRNELGRCEKARGLPASLYAQVFRRSAPIWTFRALEQVIRRPKWCAKKYFAGAENCLYYR
ncbi:hypothetical protein, partial [Acidovorax cavernicola]|uniref:hypothetical protein n=1 Tax=Acidovorax cavernicola TaxID=1675792 RepID=UPI00197AEDF9